MKLFVRRALSFFAWCPLMLLVNGCANQTEGQRCDETNGSADCEQGLACTRIFAEGVFHFVCCPVPPQPVTAAACNAGSLPPDAGTPTDASTDRRAEAGADRGAGDTTSNDTPAETTIDRSTVDTPSDVPADRRADMSIADTSTDGVVDVSNDISNDLSNDLSVDAPPTIDVAVDGTTIDVPTPPEAASDAIPDGPDATEAAPPDAVLDVTDVIPPLDVFDAPDVTPDGPG